MLLAVEGAVSVTVRLTVRIVVPPVPVAVSCGVPEMTPAGLIVMPVGSPEADQL